MARPDPASKNSKKKERRQTHIRRTKRSEDDTPTIVQRPTSDVAPQSPTARATAAPALSQQRLRATNPAPDLPENTQRTTLPPPAPMPVVRGRPPRDDLSAPQARTPDWRDRLAVFGLLVLVIAMLAAMWRIMVS